MPLKSKLFLVLFALLICLSNLTALPKHLRGLAGLVIFPITSPISVLYSRLSEQFFSFTRTQDLIDQNFKLKNQVQELEKKLLILSEIDENIELKSQLVQFFGFEENALLASYVKDFYSLNQNNYITLDKGSKLGVQIGNNVVNGRMLIGTVISVNTYSSNVLLINSNEVQVPAKVAGIETFGIFSCENKKCSFNKVLTEQEIKVGDILVTSGGGERYLPSLLLGSVMSINSQPAQVFKTAALNYNLEPTKLNKVIIILKNE